MRMSDTYINDQLNTAQKLLWSGSLHEVDEAHNIIAKLISDRIEQTNLTQGQKKSLTKAIYNSVNS